MERPGPDDEHPADALLQTTRIWKRALRSWTRLRLSGDQDEAQRKIKELVEIKNQNLWFLIASAVIASVGLNMNSVAIVIGAMLISPLMGPMVGFGYALAVRDRAFARRAALYFFVSVALTLAVSTAYFVISPLGQPTHEILVRTSPNLLDLLVALAAALAGVIALTTAGVSAALPGVAVAIAITPPICAAGFGVATMRLALAGGAFYLFVVNAGAIILCSYVLFRRMHFVETPKASGGRMTPGVVLALTVVFIAPLAYSLYRTVVSSREQQAAAAFVGGVSRQHRVASWTFQPGRKPVLSMFLFDQPSAEERGRLAREIQKKVPRCTLQIQTTDLSPEVRQTLDNLQASVIDSRTAVRQIQATLEANRLAAAEQATARAQKAESSPETEWADLTAEWKLLEPRIETAMAYRPLASGDDWIIEAKTVRPLAKKDRAEFLRKWSAWFSMRLKHACRVHLSD